MKAIVYIITICILTLPALVRAQKFEMRAEMDKDIPLAEAIRRANQKFPDAPPLTEDEVIAAVQAIRLTHPDLDEATSQLFERVAKEKVLPKNMYFIRLAEWHTPYGHFYVDWWDLTLLLDKPPTARAAIPLPRLPANVKLLQTEQPQPSFTYRIRAKFVSSRPLSEAEAKELKE